MEIGLNTFAGSISPEQQWGGWDVISDIGQAVVRGIFNGNGNGAQPGGPGVPPWAYTAYSRILQPGQVGTTVDAPGGYCDPSIFYGEARPRRRMVSQLIVPHATTGNPVVYQNMGSIRLTSGSFREHGKVNKLAKKARRPARRNSKRK